MDIRVSLDASDVTRTMRWLHQDQVPYATSVAINNVAKRFQDVQHAHMARAFTVRRPMFVGRSVKIKPFSSKRSLVAVVKIEPPGGVSRADVLSKFEGGGTKTAKDGGRIAVPDEVRRGKTGSIGKMQRPKAFNFRVHGVGPQAEVLVGDKRTFMIRKTDGTGGIYQRTGRGGSTRLASSLATRKLHDLNVKTLYHFTREARIDSRLKFEENAEGTISAHFARSFDEAFNRAIASGRTQVVGRKGGVSITQASKGARRIGRSDVSW